MTPSLRRAEELLEQILQEEAGSYVRVVVMNRFRAALRASQAGEPCRLCQETRGGCYKHCPVGESAPTPPAEEAKPLRPCPNCGKPWDDHTHWVCTKGGFCSDERDKGGKCSKCGFSSPSRAPSNEKGEKR